ncbi:NAD-specific glutamate dehydrogenase [Mizugakiibacter sediminis]|uniref:Glutamate dehydrogenase n=1 Tax=Mizugakiibacter sediminis TaxID=1475481 RepID=A0A0K8QR30_9GAMM|nr:NAD-glutamate dehydrogenase domain-containing protein [Mizugakiibacter sediminis]GAP67384.1 NAD-specific glutamate dehydrogenase [Mizugakiibacter sediminis]
MNAQRSADGAAFAATVVREFAPTLAGARLELARALASALFARIAPGDTPLHDTPTWAALAADLLEFMRVRTPGVAAVRVFNPERSRNGWECARTVVQVATDDMPFLVDSIGMALAAAGLQIHVVLHPVLPVARDAAGHLQKLGEGAAESISHFEIDRVADAAELERLRAAVAAALDDVRAAVGGWRAMRERMLAIADELPRRTMPVDARGVAEAQEFLRWVADDHFTFLGYREYEVAAVDGDEVLKAVEGSGLGIMSGRERSLALRSLKTLVAATLPQSGSMDAIILTKTSARATVHRPGYMDYIGVLKFDAGGRPIAEQRFLGLFTSSAYMRRPQDVPLVRQKFEAVMNRSGLKRDSHSGKALRHILETLPRDELFQAGEDELYAIAMGILELSERARTRLFARRDKYGRFVSCLVFVPRERFSTGVRERIEATLKQALHGERLDSAMLLGESPLARLHLVIRPRPGDHVQFDAEEIEARLAQIVRDWHDELRETLVQRLGEQRGLELANRYGRALPPGYIEEVTPAVAAGDVEMAASLEGPDAIRQSLYRSPNRPDELHFKVFRSGADIALSEVLPLLENLGMRVLTEDLHQLDVQGTRLFIQDIKVQPAQAMTFDVAEVRATFEDAFERIWRGEAENDAFNRLILGARLSWRQVALLRGYCKYLLQVGVPFSQSYMEETLNRYPLVAGLLVELFEAKFDPQRESAAPEALAAARRQFEQELAALLPETTAKAHPDFVARLVAARGEPRQAQIDALIEAIKTLLDNVASLDEDRILRSFMGVIRASLRTNYYQTRDGRPKDCISIKFDCAQVPDLPKPRPYREIFVYSPRVEGVHLRFGPVARGGLRWSDRREDFRTEVLGLVKAQMVKNTVIVPVGSKGGFFVKRPPAGGDRDAVLAEGIACYRIFISGLLDVTDNLVEGKVVHPDAVVRHDGDDPYLVVAADKGTATFSDIANAISAEYGFWLGDAFASGGSNGYDHKGMGITAKGAWESVKRHFRALGRDCQREDFTCVGIGDMSGDVFGNGMLLSRHIRLVAAFDHRHIFLDPNPDAAKSFAERQRMFKLPRSSWDDYDKSLISAGGGVYARSLKSIPVSPEVRAALGIAEGVTQMSPAELMSAILKAPVDLLWNGGIGTYVKASSETNADAGDRANNAIRINGADLRCKVVGEGGNLGFTQKGRIEAAQHGVLLNTDFIDNSAGVDTSDHEVNIKILLNDAVQRGELTLEARNRLLAAMTDEVERLVLWDNYRQNQAISLMERMSVSRLGSMAHFIRTLEGEGLLDRQVESLPSDAELAERKARGMGLTRPELAILLSYDKIKLYQQLLDSDVPEDPYLSKELVRYFPEPLHVPYAAHMQRHSLKREIIATAVTNSTINRMGATFMLRMQEDTGQGPAAIAKAYSAAREILDARTLWGEIEALDGKVGDAVQSDAMLKIWHLLRHLTRWLLNRPGGSLDIAGNVERYAPGVAELRRALPAALTAAGQAAFAADVEAWKERGLPPSLAQQLATIPVLGAALDVVEVARDSGKPEAQVAAVFFELGEALELDWLREQIELLPVESRWHAQARGSLRDELNAQHRTLAVQVLSRIGKGKADGAVAAWLGRDDAGLKFTLGMLAEIRSQSVDYPIASVALRRLAQLAQAGAA